MTNSLVRDDMNDYWDKTQDEIKAELRLAYLQTFVKPPSSYCPECGHNLIVTEDEIYCTRCGLITSSSIQYVAGTKIDLPYGVRI